MAAERLDGRFQSRGLGCGFPKEMGFVQNTKLEDSRALLPHGAIERLSFIIYLMLPNLGKIIHLVVIYMVILNGAYQLFIEPSVAWIDANPAIGPAVRPGYYMAATNLNCSELFGRSALCLSLISD